MGRSESHEKGECRTASDCFRNLGVVDAWEGYTGVREQRGRTVLFVPPECGTRTCHPFIVDDTSSSIKCELIRTQGGLEAGVGLWAVRISSPGASGVVARRVPTWK